MKHLLIILVLFFVSMAGVAQQDTSKVKNLIQQYQNMNIPIDPNNMPKNEKEAEEYKKKVLKQIQQNQGIDPKNMNKQDIENYKKQKIQEANDLKNKYSNYNIKAPVKKKSYVVQNIEIKDYSKQYVVSIAQRFYERSYKLLISTNKINFDKDLKRLNESEDKSIFAHQFTGIGANLTALSDDGDLACVYLTLAVIKSPLDTAAINNFGAYLRIIDSVSVSLPVLYYANSVCPSSPLILTQIGNSLFELGDHVKAEDFFKQALKSNPDFGPAHTGLCSVYIVRGDVKNAILELFRGVKQVFPASAPQAYRNMQKDYASNPSMGEFPANDILNTIKSESFDVSNVERIDLPNFPQYKDLNGWQVSGYAEAVQRNGAFINYNIAYLKKMQADYHTSAPIYQYEQEYFMVTSTLGLLDSIHCRQDREYARRIKKLHKSNVAQNEIYLTKFEIFSKQYVDCITSCGGDEKCLKACQKKNCANNCPNADELNSLLKGNFEEYNHLFAEYRNQQRQNISDVYAFTQPWIDKIQNLGWSKITEYDRKSLVLKMIGSCYSNYIYISPMQQIGCEDCSIIYQPEKEDQEDVKDKEVKGNDCTSDLKKKIEILICEISSDCDGIEFGCTAVASASIKRNFRNKSTTVFAGVGGKAELGFADASGKAGFTYTRADNGSEDLGVRVEVGASTGKYIKNGQSVEMNYSLMGGLNVQRSTELSIGF
jgi:tetratricopeptide (TPR) repeat protein